MQTRIVKDIDTELLKDFLFQAIYIPEGTEPPARKILERPELKVYYEGFGQGKTDHLIAADDNGTIVGAVWSRIMHDYGHVDEGTPSLAISLYKEYHSRGIGTGLMKEMLELLRLKGYQKASLAVQKANYAVKMYQKLGFEIIEENDEEYIMVCRLM